MKIRNVKAYKLDPKIKFTPNHYHLPLYYTFLYSGVSSRFKISPFWRKAGHRDYTFVGKSKVDSAIGL